MSDQKFAAYLIVVCDPVTNAPLRADVWSSPEWEQSRCLDERTFVLYKVSSFKSYSNAKEMLLEDIALPSMRYHWAWELYKKTASSRWMSPIPLSSEIL